MSADLIKKAEEYADRECNGLRGAFWDLRRDAFIEGAREALGMPADHFTGKATEMRQMSVPTKSPRLVADTAARKHDETAAEIRSLLPPTK